MFMRKLVLALSIVFVLGIAVVPSTSATPLTQDYIRYLENSGFSVTIPEEGGWLAGHTDKVTVAITLVKFPSAVTVTEVEVTFVTLKAGVDYTDAFGTVITAVLGLFPEPVHDILTKSILVTIPEHQRTNPDGWAYMVIGGFAFSGGFFTNQVGSPVFKLNMKAVGN
jgi:hypothetical protein